MAALLANDRRLAQLAKEMLSDDDLRMLKIHELGDASGGTLELARGMSSTDDAHVAGKSRASNRPDDDLDNEYDETEAPPVSLNASLNVSPEVTLRPSKSAPRPTPEEMGVPRATASHSRPA